jgi:hypothetical protein
MMHILYMVFHLEISNHKLLHQHRVVVDEYQQAEVQHLKIIHHAVQHQKKIDLMLLLLVVVVVIMKNH